jgi:recombinational DNA repair ATPase RecF
LDEYSFKKQRVDETLDNAKKESEELLDTSVLKNLYDDTQAYLVELKKTFNDLIEFNTKLNHNKINYFQKQAEKWDEKITKVQQDREALFNNHKDIIMLIKENKIEAYTTLQEKLGSLREEMGRNKQIKDVHEKLETALSKASKDLSELKESIRSSDNNDSKIELFNKYFSKYSQLTNGESYLLYETDEGFPFAVDNVARGLSTGDKKSIIASFDLAYQKFSKDIGKTTPNFFVHDVIETLDQVALTNIVSIANEIECQYIVAVLKEKIDNNKEIKTEDIRLTLSETERLFKI